MFKIRLIIFILFFFQITELSAKIEIRYKIDTEILTNIDVLEEREYLIFLKPNLKSLDRNEMLKIAENSLIREIIKKKEIKRVFKDQENFDFIEDIKKNLFKFKNVKNETEFKNLTKVNNINYEKIIDKIKYEAMWNELIFQKYSSFIKIDENELKNQLIEKSSKVKKFEYKLSEILYEVKNNENFKDKNKTVFNYIKNNDFKVAATKFSISNSSNKGGEIGWIKETLLSKNLNNILSKMEINQISEPIKHPSGYLILKINDKKKMKQIIDIDKELKDLINFEKNKQLNQFSLLYFKKLKQNVIINEF